MRGFLLLCVGVVLLLACCLVAFVTAVGIGGMFIPGIGLWFLLGIPLALVLFGGGIVLCMAFVEDGPASRVFFGALVVALVALLVAFVPGIIGGPATYQKYYGEKTTAVVTSIIANNGENGGVIKEQYFVRDDATGEDLGVLADAPWTKTARGDRIEVFADPRGWVPPVAADHMAQATVPAIIVAGCFAVIALAALAVIAAAALGTVRSQR